MFNKYVIPSVLFSLLFSLSVNADSESGKGEYLRFSSERCVALHQGQTCYLDVTVEWRMNNIGDYCLVDVTENAILKCWNKMTRGKFEFEFQRAKSADFVLRSAGAQNDLLKGNIQVVWVYSAPKRTKSNWRLF